MTPKFTAERSQKKTVIKEKRCIMLRAHSLYTWQHEVCCNLRCRYKCFIRERTVISAFRIKSYQSLNVFQMNKHPNTFKSLKVC